MSSQQQAQALGRVDVVLDHQAAAEVFRPFAARSGHGSLHNSCFETALPAENRAAITAARGTTVPEMGLQPANLSGSEILSLLRIPFRHSGGGQILQRWDIFITPSPCYSPGDLPRGFCFWGRFLLARLPGEARTMTDDDFAAASRTAPSPTPPSTTATTSGWPGSTCAGIPPLDALARFTAGLQRFATFHGHPGLYHETITWAYLFLIHERMADSRARRRRDLGGVRGAPSGPAHLEAVDPRPLLRSGDAALRPGAARFRATVPDT